LLIFDKVTDKTKWAPFLWLTVYIKDTHKCIDIDFGDNISLTSLEREQQF